MNLAYGKDLSAGKFPASGIDTLNYLLLSTIYRASSKIIGLGCLLHPEPGQTDDLTVLRLLPSDTTMVSATAFTPWASGQEKVTAVMFADLRDFTGTTEHRLPFDVVYLVNQLSRAMGTVVENNGRRIDKF